MKRHLLVRSAVRLGLCGLAVLIATPTLAQSRIVQIEEHWEMRVGEADSATSAPQTTMVMSPNGHLGAHYFLFTINHETAPSYSPGGMQVQLWNGDAMVNYDFSDEHGTLSYTDEVVSWVQRMAVSDGTLHFDIEDGSSTTWGIFRGTDIDISTPTSLTDLNDYLASVSLTESQVGYSENRVTSLTLTKIRWVTDDGQVHEYNAPIPIDVSLDP